MTKEMFKQIEKNKKLVGVFPFEFDDSGAGADGKVAIPDTIHLIPIGQWDHDLYGSIIIKDSDIQEFVNNFNAGIRKGVFITAGHEGYQELPAVAWVKSVEARGDGLYGFVEWTGLGKSILEDKQFKFFSPEYCTIYEDPETHEVSRNVLTGGALTKSPYFKELEAIVFCEPNIKKIFNDNNKNLMLIEDILKKDPTALSAEEKAFLKEHEAELTDEQKTQFESALKVEAPVETEDEKAAREQKEQEDANEAAGLNRDGSPKENTAEEIAASEKKDPVTMSFAEHTALNTAATAGAEAIRKLADIELTADVQKLIYTEGNKAGRFLPKQEAAVKTFMSGLVPEKRKAFSSIIASLPEAKVFAELGDGKPVDGGDAHKEVETRVAKVIADDKLSYAEALKKVFSEDAGLQKRYNEQTEADA